VRIRKRQILFSPFCMTTHFSPEIVFILIEYDFRTEDDLREIDFVLKKLLIDSNPSLWKLTVVEYKYVQR